MKKKLSLAQIFFLIVAACLPFVDGMFKWTASNLYRGTYFVYNKSLENIMTVQEIGAGPVVFYLFYILLAITVIVYIISALGNTTVSNSKAVIILPILLVIVASIMIFSAAAYYVPLQGLADVTSILVDIQLLGFIEIGVLVATLIIEIYKLRVCVD